MKIVLTITDENVEALQPHLKVSNRNIKNYIECLYLAAIKSNPNGYIDLAHLGKVTNPAP